MPYKKFVINQEESLCLTPLDQQIINTILKGLIKAKNNCARLSRIYTYCRRELNKPCLDDYKIKYLILVLRLGGLIRIINRKGKKTHCWTNYIFLNKKNFEIYKTKKEQAKESYDKITKPGETTTLS